MSPLPVARPRRPAPPAPDPAPPDRHGMQRDHPPLPWPLIRPRLPLALFQRLKQRCQARNRRDVNEKNK